MDTDTTIIPVTAAQRAEVERMLRERALAPRLRERLEMVKAASLGADWDAIAAWSGRTPRTIRHWLMRFLAGGIGALTDAPRSGRPRVADCAYSTALDHAAETSPRALGLPFDAWTSARLSAYLTEITGVRIAPGWLRALLTPQRFRCGRPKHTLTHLQDADAVAICEAAIAEAEKKGGGGTGARRTALSGRDASRDQSVSRQAMASHRQAATDRVGRSESAGNGLRQRGEPGTGTD